MKLTLQTMRCILLATSYTVAVLPRIAHSQASVNIFDTIVTKSPTCSKEEIPSESSLRSAPRTLQENHSSLTGLVYSFFDIILWPINLIDILRLIPNAPSGRDPGPPLAQCGTLTYFPGEFDGQKKENGVILSRGLKSRRLTRWGDRLLFDTGAQSFFFTTMHPFADGAAVIHKLDQNLQETGGYYYCSNSEVPRLVPFFIGGGVGCIEFNEQHEMVGYEKLLSNTARNCGGGRSPWNTWISCEEAGNKGLVYEVNPNYRVMGGARSWQTVLVDEGGNFESTAWWRDSKNDQYHFFITEDSKDGAMVHFTPARPASETDAQALEERLTSSGSYTFLNYLDNVRDAGPGDTGRFEWTNDRATGEASAANYPSSEGIDIRGDFLYFVSKKDKELHTLNLRNLTYVVASTASGTENEFRGQPDQIAKILGDDRDIIHFCEDDEDGDVHAIDNTNQYYTIVHGEDYGCETTGLTFSPDYKMMYVAFQCQSAILQIWREDGCAFGMDPVFGIKYHTEQ